MNSSFKIIIDNSSGVKQSAEIEQQSELLLIESNDMNEELMEDNGTTPVELTENNDANEQPDTSSSQKVEQTEEQTSIAAKEKLYFNKASDLCEIADNLVNKK